MMSLAAIVNGAAFNHGGQLGADPAVEGAPHLEQVVGGVAVPCRHLNRHVCPKGNSPCPGEAREEPGQRHEARIPEGMLHFTR